MERKVDHKNQKIKPKEHFHGSDLEKIEKIYGIRKEDITSFSANVNPLGISPKLRETLASHVDAITTYPDREYTSLRSCIADYVGADMKNILVGNGSTELISLIIQIEHPKKAMIIGPILNMSVRSSSAAVQPSIIRCARAMVSAFSRMTSSPN